MLGTRCSSSSFLSDLKTVTMKILQPTSPSSRRPNFWPCLSAMAPRSEAFILADMTRKIILVGGTKYAGEMKKSIFGVMNFLLPGRDVFPMHCSANVGQDGVTALFFGLSGTGKTTLSADPTRRLIGDDEHGWSASGIFNIEGGCYAKCVDLSEEKEPQIYHAIRFGAVLENVVLDPETRQPDYEDIRYTENTRAAFPVEFIENAVIPGTGSHPRNVMFLAADAFGRSASYRQADARPGHVPLPLWLHGQARRHGIWAR